MNNIPFDKSFASHEKAKYWSKKNTLKSSEVSKGSDKKFYFDCDKCNHEFLIQLNIVSRGGWCNLCSNRVLCDDENCIQCFEKSFASNEKSKYWSSKNNILPRQVFKSAGNKYIFNCDKCNHEFSSSLDKIKIGRWCPYCCNPQKKLCGNKDCLDCHNKSFASHEKSKYWSNKNELKPEFVLKNGDKRIWFNCDVCQHDFEKQIKYVSKDGWCPYCKSYKLCDNIDCQLCFNRSFASHEKSKYWSSKNDILPRQAVQGSGIKFWFNCDICNHDFEKSLNDITGYKDGWCPYCCIPQKKLCEDNTCIDCYNKSFASHEKVKYWSSKNKENPRQVFKGGDSKKYWFNCNKCDLEFEMYPLNVKIGRWCSFCINKTEGKLYKILKEQYPSILYQYRVEWCKNTSYLPFDFCIPEYKIIIELDGPQHFTQIMEWKSPEEQHEIDKYKEKCANENGYCLIRILQSDVLNDTYDWFKELKDSIEELNKGNEIANIYLYKNNEYDVFFK
jgi:very-short-patch-repair endonuclease